MKNLLGLITFLFIFSSACNNSSIKKEYDEEGNLKRECGYIDEHFCKCKDYDAHGNIIASYSETNDYGKIVRIYYNSDGTLKSIEQYSGALKNGDFIKFSNSNSVQNIEHYNNGKLIGDNVYFNNSFFSKWQRNKLVDSVSFTNEWAFFDDDANLSLQTGNYFGIKSSYDTISKGETFNLQVTLLVPYYGKNMFVVYGNYNDKYELNDPTTLDTVNAKKEGEYWVAYKEFKPEKTGNNIIRGVIYDLNFSGKVNRTPNERRAFYFQVHYFVKDTY